MALLCDTTVLIAHLRGVDAARDLLRVAAAGDGIAASVVSRIEVEGGMRSAERSDVARLFGALEMIPVTDVVAAEVGRQLRRYRRSHHIDLADYVIAATAVVGGHRLATLNVRHFPMFEGLRPAF